jgi:hypothetical protein
MILLKETADDTIQGIIDGINTDYVVSFDFQATSVNVFLNGVLLERDRDNGFWEIPPRTVRFKIAPKTDDSVQIEYKADILTGGGAEGGCPNPPSVEIIEPDLQSENAVPLLSSDLIEPIITVDGEEAPTTFSDDIKPVLLKPGS